MVFLLSEMKYSRKAKGNVFDVVPIHESTQDYQSLAILVCAYVLTQLHIYLLTQWFK